MASTLMFRSFIVWFVGHSFFFSFSWYPWIEESFTQYSYIFLTGSISGVASSNSYVVDPTERKNNALMALQLLCESPVLNPHLKEMLVAKWVSSCVTVIYIKKLPNIILLVLSYKYTFNILLQILNILHRIVYL